MNGSPFRAVLEPDGKQSHWFKVGPELRKAAGADVGDTVTLEIEPTREWPEPKVSADLQGALAADSRARVLWLDITPMARWDWIRWIGSTRNSETRRRRIANACDLLKDGKRQPCCFNRTERTLTDA